MPRRKKANRVNEHQCYVCSARFEAVRDDARYCGPKCRKQISRAMHAIKAATSAMKKGPVKVLACGKCGAERVEQFKSCPLCGSRRQPK